jgi:hypothetical protein
LLSVKLPRLNDLPVPAVADWFDAAVAVMLTGAGATVAVKVPVLEIMPPSDTVTDTVSAPAEL